MSTISDQEIIRRAMSVLGKSKTEKKLTALSENRKKFTGHTEETKTKLKEAQQVRREKERKLRELAGMMTSPVPKRKRGRPKKQTTLDLVPVS